MNPASILVNEEVCSSIQQSLLI